MELITNLIDFVLNLDKHLTGIIQNYGGWTYLILFIIIFCETGLVVTPFLPGDSVIFVIGALSAVGKLRVELIAVMLIIAAVAGDTVNYHIGKAIGLKLFKKEKTRFFKKEYLIRTHEFYEKHGGKTIILARFIPIIRTFAPFVAGMGKMSYFHFIGYNVIGGIVWVSLFIAGGYFFGNIPIIENNFSLVTFAIIFISLLPPLVGFLNQKLKSAKDNK